MTTLVLEEMPNLFWTEIVRRGYAHFFKKECESSDVQIAIIRTHTIADRNFINKFKNLKMIIRAGTGLDNVDVKYAESQNIIVKNTPEANTNAAYEHTIAIIFSLIKNLNAAKANVLENKWKSGLRYNFEMADLKALVVGLGRIGSRVAKALDFFGAKVYGVDPYISDDVWQKIPAEKINYNEGLRRCNLVTFHCPLTAETENYFSLESLDIIEYPIFLINAARGKIVQEESIAIGLEKGKILGAAIDVFASEPWISKEYAFDKRVVVTPHSGSFTQRAKNRMSLETIEVWEKFISHQKF